MTTPAVRLLGCILSFAPAVARGQGLSYVEMPAVSGQEWWLSQGWRTTCARASHGSEPAWDFNVGSVADDYGMPVASGADGVVCQAGIRPGSSYGRVVIVRYGSDEGAHKCTSIGQFGLFAHLADVAVHKGQRVRSGQVVGYIGGSGGGSACGGGFDETCWDVHFHYSNLHRTHPTFEYLDLDMRFELNRGGSAVVGRPGPYCAPGWADDGEHRYRSWNDILWREAYARYGGTGILGSPPRSDVYLADWQTPFRAWIVDPSIAFAPDWVPRTYYRIPMVGERVGQAELIYDVLAGGRSVRIIQQSFGAYFTAVCGGPEGPCGPVEEGLGPPITDQSAGGSRQDFMRGYMLFDLATGMVSVARHSTVAPGAKSAGIWRPKISYAFSDAYGRNGGAPLLGSPADGGAGAGIHSWYDVLSQGFLADSPLCGSRPLDRTSLLAVNWSDAAAYLVKCGFRETYTGSYAPGSSDPVVAILGPPIDEEHGSGGETCQRFERGSMLWDGSRVAVYEDRSGLVTCGSGMLFCIRPSGATVCTRS